MKLASVLVLLDATILNSVDNPVEDINYAFSVDLMSDAFVSLKDAPDTFFQEGVLVTGNTTMQSIRTAELLDFSIVIFTRNKIPTEQVLAYATSKNIMVLSTKHALFTTSGLLYNNNVLGYSDL